MNSDASMIRVIRGPVTLITIGVLFALNNFTPYNFGKTWPVLLIVFGLMSLLGRGTMEPSYPQPPNYPYNPPPQGSYDPQTGAYQPKPTYNAPPAGQPGRGGFGTTAPPRPTAPETPATPPSEGGSV